MKILDANDPFFAPLWRRWVTVLVPTASGALDLASGNPGWGILFVAIGAYAYWELIHKGPASS